MWSIVTVIFANIMFFLGLTYEKNFHVVTLAIFALVGAALTHFWVNIIVSQNMHVDNIESLLPREVAQLMQIAHIMAIITTIIITGFVFYYKKWKEQKA